ncbi:hypothetical protein GCM10011516_32200 [Sphingobacterium cellulitidis]|uniref:HTH araC/xylS-type domain-containing protein n=1 Tax=Sphingobacterium cellulitidis TaxID=1768011 RepID=A0A8H9G3M0_9SPHI|nr:hypothetical protein CHT99_06450 [Sphingobacterium cellulitidis]GGE32037.1 hypothetical protein GCM10011516_32200 [Sphingobacterium soli]
MNRRLLYILYITIFFPNLLFSQRTAFEKRYAAVRAELMAKDYKEALRVADSLEQISESDISKIRAQNLVALVHQSVGTYSIAINYANRADQLSNLIGFPDFEASSALVLASIYRDIGIFGQASNYIERAEVDIQSVKDSLVRKQLEIQLLQEKAYQSIFNKKYTEAVDLMEIALSKKGYIDVNNPRSFLIRSKNHLIIAESYLALGMYKESITYLKMILDDVYGVETIIKPFTFQCLAENYFNLGLIDSTRTYLDQTIPYVEGSNNIKLKKQYYFLEAKYYRKKGLDHEAIQFVDKYSQLEEQHRNTAQIIGNNLIRDYLGEIKTIKRNNVVLIWSLIILTSICLLFYLIKIRPKRSKSEAIDIDFVPPTAKPIVSNQSSNYTSKDIIQSSGEFHISIETETRLVKKLNDLELELFFLNKNLTLSWITNKLDTNQKYVSYIIRKYKNQHFNDYILNLRIQYIVKQLEVNKILWDYKLSYLAEMSGFTSHSKFTIAFKSVVGVTPSQFIENLKQNSKSEI